LAIWAKEVSCDYCQELRFSTLIHNKRGSHLTKVPADPDIGVVDMLKHASQRLELSSRSFVGRFEEAAEGRLYIVLPGLASWVFQAADLMEFLNKTHFR
jgi:hypothetical protein